MSKNNIPIFEVYSNTIIASGKDAKNIYRALLVLSLRNAKSIDQILNILIKINKLR